MHSTGSILKDIVNRMSLQLNVLFGTGKLNESDLMAVLHPAFEEALNRVSFSDDRRVIVRYRVSLVADQEYYTLPPTVDRVVKLAAVDDNGDEMWEYDARNDHHPQGPVWALDGRNLRMDPIPKNASNLDVWFVPSASFGFHFSDDGGTINSATSFTLDSTLGGNEDLGIYDRRPNAYVGAMLRVLPASGAWDETVVTAQDGTTLTLRDNLSVSSGSTQRYELVPTYLQPMSELVALIACLKMVMPLNLSQRQLVTLDQNRAAAVKVVRDQLTNINERRGNFWETETAYSRDMAFGSWIPVSA